jgi:hypothetical protein
VTTTIPDRLAHLPVDDHGRPIPWFTATVDGVPDLRIARAGAVVDAIRLSSCWICGRRRAATATFVTGPLATINRVHSEPPSHPECARYAVVACPFLSRPQMRRRDVDAPTAPAAGWMVAGNPGVAVLWRSRRFRARPAPDGGILFNLGDPVEVTWWRQGRPASREEAVAALAAAYSVVTEWIVNERGPEAAALRWAVDRYAAAQAWLPDR